MNTNTVESQAVSTDDQGIVLESCRKAIRAGAVAAFISAGITLAAILLAESGARGFSVWNLLDVALLAVLGTFVYRKSRVSATLLMAYFVVDTALLWIAAGEPIGLVMRSIFFVLYLNAMQATYRWHRLQRVAGQLPVLV